MKLKFTKMSGAGNDFIFLGPEYAALIPRLSWLAAKLCPRRVSVGADGVVLVEMNSGSPGGTGAPITPARSGIFMHYFNSDGSEASFCGNGARCLVRYCLERNLARGPIIFRSKSGTHHGEAAAEGIRIDLKMPALVRHSQVTAEGGPAGRAGYEIYLVDAGVPHAVLLARDIVSIDVDGVGRALRYHPDFAPDGANVDFVDVARGEPFGLRTYERGVEQETLACGSGCLAAALTLRLAGLAGNQVRLRVASGDILRVELAARPDEVAYLTGPAVIIYEGEIDLKETDDV